MPRSPNDIKSLAAAPANLIDSGKLYGNQPNNADLSAGVANLFGNMPTNLNDPKILAAQNAFIGASYDTGATLVGSKNSNDLEAGQALYAQGSQALSETPFTNQSQVLYDMGPGKVGDVIKNSLGGEGVLGATSDDDKSPLTGTAGLLNTLTANGYDDDGDRLSSDSVQQQEIVSACKAGVDSISNKGNDDYQNLLNADLNGSGVRQALSGIFAAGLPSILNAEAVKSSGGSNPVAPGEINATDLGKFMEFELGGHYASQSQGEKVGQNIAVRSANFTTTQRRCRKAVFRQTSHRRNRTRPQRRRLKRSTVRNCLRTRRTRVSAIRMRLRKTHCRSSERHCTAQTRASRISTRGHRATAISGRRMPASSAGSSLRQARRCP